MDKETIDNSGGLAGGFSNKPWTNPSMNVLMDRQ
jgi:hypothetical protein